MKWYCLTLQILCLVVAFSGFKTEIFAVMHFVCFIGYQCFKEIDDLKRRLNLK